MARIALAITRQLSRTKPRAGCSLGCLTVGDEIMNPFADSSFTLCTYIYSIICALLQYELKFYLNLIESHPISHNNLFLLCIRYI